MSAFGLDGQSRGSPEKVENLLMQSKNFKDEGNKLYLSKDYKGAVRNYHKALLFLRSLTHGQNSVGSLMGFENKLEIPVEMLELVAKLTVDCNNNLAACLLQRDQPDYSKVLQYSETAAKQQPTNYKAHFRKGMALYHLKEYDKALAALLLANEHMNETDQQVKKYINLCHNALQQQDKKLKETYKHMFAGVSVCRPTSSAAAEVDTA